jgi:hypothetical protein
MSRQKFKPEPVHQGQGLPFFSLFAPVSCMSEDAPLSLFCFYLPLLNKSLLALYFASFPFCKTSHNPFRHRFQGPVIHVGTELSMISHFCLVRDPLHPSPFYCAPSKAKPENYCPIKYRVT